MHAFALPLKADLIKDIPLRNVSYLCNTAGKGGTGTFCLVQQDKTGRLSLCHAFKVGKGVTEKVASAVAVATKLRQGKISLGQLNTVMTEGRCAPEMVGKVESAWALRAREVDKGAMLAEFHGCAFFGTLDVRRSDTPAKFQETCEKIVQRGFTTIVTLTIYTHCIEVAEEHPDESFAGLGGAGDDDGGHAGVFQMFHIASLRFAKQVEKGLCYVVQG